MKPTVSIILPAFNAENFIERSVKSVLAQTCRQFELIVVDDYSTDGTVGIIAQLSRDYREIVFLSNTRKKGPSGARNMGLLQAKGDYIAFLDADDTWHPHHLAMGLSFLKAHINVDAVFFNFNIVDPEHIENNNWFVKKNFTKVLKTEVLDNNSCVIKDNLFYALLDESFIQLQAIMIRKTVCGATILFNEEIMRAEDLDFVMRLYLESGAKFAYSDVITSDYYRHANSLTTPNIDNEISTLIDHITLFKSYLVKYADDNVAKYKLKRILYNRHLNLSYCFRKKQRHLPAMLHLFKSAEFGYDAQQLVELLKIFVSTMQKSCEPLSGKADEKTGIS